MRGDLLFWTSDGSPLSRLVAIATHGPYCHVSVDLGDGTDIGAHSEDGVQRHPITGLASITRYRVEASQDAIDKGIDFLMGEIGDKYGFCNILNAGLAILHLPYRVTRLNRYDCSSLVSRYLDVLGIQTDQDIQEQPDSVSPNDLARALGVIGPKAVAALLLS